MKKLFFIVLSALFVAFVFADPTMSILSADPRTGFASSASRQSTMFTMGTEADSIHAKGIVDIARPFFATGFLDDGGVVISPNLQGVFGVPITDDISFGAIFDYKINAFRDEQSSYNIETDTSNTRTENSTYNVRVAFGWKNFGIHSRTSKTGNETNTIGGAQLLANTKETKQEYEVGISYKMDGVFNFYSTLGGIYDRTAAITDSYVDSNGTTTIIEKNNAVTFFAFPQIEFPVSFGPLVTLRTGINIGVDVYNLGDSTALITTVLEKAGGSEETSSVHAVFKDRDNFTLGIDGGASLAWFKEKVIVLAEPYLGFDYARRSDTISSITETKAGGTEEITNPNDKRIVDSYDSYAGLNVGISIKPTSWFEFRGGLSYGLNWDSTVIKTHVVSTDTHTKEYDFHLTTNFMTGLGVGFVLAEDFLLDIHVKSATSLFELDTFGVSALYRF